MKFLKHFTFRKICVISAIVIGVGGLLFYLISTRKIDESEAEADVRTPDQRREAVLESSGQSTVQSSQRPSQADIEKAIAALESLDATERLNEGVENSGDETNPETLLIDSGDETLLSDEEERKQRRERIMNSPEYKALKAKIIELALELTEWSKVGVERPAKRAHIAYMRNPYSVFGLTKEEGDGFEIELSDEQVKFMHEEGKRLYREEQTETVQWKEVWDENLRQRRELSQQIEDLFKEDGQ